MRMPHFDPWKGNITGFFGGVRWKVAAVFGFGVALQPTFLPVVVADLPPHCLAKHVIGEWDVHEGLWQPCTHLDNNMKDLHDPYCGHTTPDKVGTHGALTPPNVSKNFRQLRMSRMTLHENFSVTFDDGSTGSWTMVYDEGLHLEVTGPRRQRFFSFFKYELSADGKNTARSFCHTLMVGWWEQVSFQDSPETELAKYPPKYDIPEIHDSDSLPEKGCWWAEKVGEDHLRPTNIVPSSRKSPVDMPGMPLRRDPDISQVVVHSQIHSVINGKQSWEPTENDYVILSGKRLRTLSEINEAAGAPRLKPSVEPAKVLGILSGKPHFSGSVSSQPVWKSILEFDWTNPEHVYMRLGRRQSAVPPAPDQGLCGSCYAISTSTILTSRLWIRYANNDDIFGKVTVSALQGTSCNVYNQGCAGGYVFLALKFGHEHGFRTQECVDQYTRRMKYQCHDLGGQIGTAVYKCSASPTRNELPEECNTRVRVSNWHYVGGSFGACTAEEMQKELWEKGPLAVSIEPSAELMVYKQGVFQSPYNSIVQEGKNWAWEKVDHAVVIVGWGWEKHGNSWIPYWKIRNSWGSDWGENGYARIIRGVNEMAIERVAVVADVLFYRGNTAVWPEPLISASKEPENSTIVLPSAGGTHEPAPDISHLVEGEHRSKGERESKDAAEPELLHLANLPDAEDTVRSTRAIEVVEGTVTSSTRVSLRSIKLH